MLYIYIYIYLIYIYGYGMIPSHSQGDPYCIFFFAEAEQMFQKATQSLQLREAGSHKLSLTVVIACQVPSRSCLVR